MYLSNFVVMWGLQMDCIYILHLLTANKKHRYDPRQLMKKGKQFTFCGQVKDNMFRTLVSGVSICIGYDILIFWAIANGHAPMLQWATDPIQFMVLFLIIRLL